MLLGHPHLKSHSVPLGALKLLLNGDVHAKLAAEPVLTSLFTESNGVSSAHIGCLLHLLCPALTTRLAPSTCVMVVNEGDATGWPQPNEA